MSQFRGESPLEAETHASYLNNVDDLHSRRPPVTFAELYRGEGIPRRAWNAPARGRESRRRREMKNDNRGGGTGRKNQA